MNLRQSSPARPDIALIIVATLILVLAAGTAQAVYRQVIEERATYTAVKGDYLIKIAGMLGVELSYLVEQNPRTGKHVHPGDTFTVTRRTIVPDGINDGVIVNIPDRTLYRFRGGGLIAHYPVGLGMPGWRTPRGEFKVVHKKKNPTWHVPKSMQREMRMKGEPVRTVVPPGPDNPLGRWAVDLSIPGVLIHETIWPESVYRFRSHGCIRLKARDAEDFYNSIEIGEKGRIIYEPVKVAETGGGGIFLEVHRDAYGLAGDLEEIAAREIDSAGLGGKVDWDKVKEVTLEKEGMATDVTKQVVR